MANDRTILRIVNTPAVSLIKTVRIYEQSWSAKVAVEHEDVDFDAVVRTLENPCYIASSKTVEGSFVFMNEIDVNPHGDPLRVPVKGYADGTGTFKSAYYSSASFHGPTVWRRGDE